MDSARRLWASVTMSLLTLLPQVFAAESLSGSWELISANVGISSMHTQVTHTDTILLLDRRDGGRSQILMSNNRTVDGDPSAHSVVLTLAGNQTSVRPLTILTDTWCSSGQVLADGSLIQTGGNLENMSGRTIRTFSPCLPEEGCDWVEDNATFLASGRWYSTNQILEDGETTIVVGGHRVSTYEYIPKKDGTTNHTYQLSLFQDGDINCMYPFVHMLPNGNLFIFANQDAIELEYLTNREVRTFPKMPGDVARNYPSTGSSVLLPLDGTQSYNNVTVLICGGTDPSAYLSPSLLQIAASDTCGSLAVSEDNAEWVMFSMPRRRVMGDMILLPDGNVLIINGAMNGTAGWGSADEPCLDPVMFYPHDGTFQVQAAASRPRLYHSTANLLPDGRVLVAGSNTHVHYDFHAKFPTDLSIEVFSPGYLTNPTHSTPEFFGAIPTDFAYGQLFTIDVSLPKDTGALGEDQPFGLRLSSAPFSTHSLSMGQRQLNLPIITAISQGYRLNVSTLISTAPLNSSLAPPGYYMLFPLYYEVPGTATWVRLG